MKTSLNKLIIGLLCCFFTALPVFAAPFSSEIESALQDTIELKNINSETTALELAEHAFNLNTSQPDSSIQYGAGIVRLAKSKKWYTAEMEGLFSMAAGYSSKGKYNESNACLERMSILARRHQDDFRLLKAESHLGLNHNMMGNLFTALQYFLQAKSRIKPTDTENNQIIYLNIANIYSALKLHEKAVEVYRQCLIFAQNVGNKYMEAIVSGNLAGTLIQLGKFDEVEALARHSLALSEELNDVVGIGFAYCTLAEYYIHNNDLKNGEIHVQKSIEAYNSVDNKHGLVDANLALAKLRQMKPDLNEALYYAQKAYELANDISANTARLYASRLLSEIYAAMGKHNKAYEFQLKTQNIVDSLNTLRVSELLSGFENERLLSLKKAQEEAFNIERKLQKRFNNIITAISAILLIGLILLAWVSYRLYKLNIKLGKQALELEKAANFKTRLISILSHDLRSPLNSMEGMLHLLDEELLKSGDLQQLKTDLIKRFQSTNTHLQNVLNWVKSQIEGENVQPQKVECHQLINNSIEFLADTSKQKAIVIQNNTPSPTYAFADPNLLDVIFRNLLSNALKFSHTHSVVSINCKTQSDKIIFSVTDFGVGIEADKQSKLFKDVKSHAIGTLGEVGTGLGLIISRDAVEKLGGELWFESEPGKYTTFYFSVPLA